MLNRYLDFCKCSVNCWVKEELTNKIEMLNTDSMPYLNWPKQAHKVLSLGQLVRCFEVPTFVTIGQHLFG